MSEQNKIQLFENQPIRTAWNEEQEQLSCTKISYN